MKAFIAIDSFKGAAGSREAGEAAARGLLEGGLGAEDIRVYPMSDGGEGFCDCVAQYLLDSERVAIEVTAPQSNRVAAEYLISGDTAYIESASACGYTLIQGERPDPRTLTSAGVGEMILSAVTKGCKRIVLGLGGTATMDCGLGMLAAMEPVINTEIEFTICTDTFAPLTGRSGAAYLYGEQKGLRHEQLAEADEWLATQAARLGVDPSTPAFGAAGGLAAALSSKQQIKILSGADFIIDLSGLKQDIALAKAQGEKVIIITGEGRLDRQSLTGKLTGKISSLRQNAEETKQKDLSLRQSAEETEQKGFSLRQSAEETKIICLVGAVEKGLENTNLFDKIITITLPNTPLEIALQQTTENIRVAILRNFDYICES